MKKFFIALAIFTAIFSGCEPKTSTHHMALNDPKGIDTEFSGGKLQIIGNDSPFLVFFFSTTCVACSQQVPSLVELGKEFENVKFYGIMGNSKGFDKDIEILKAKNVEFMTFSAQSSVDYFSNAVGGIYGVPATFLFDKNGKIAKKYIGLTPKSTIEKDIKILL